MNSCCVIGLGYIGLPTAALIAKSGIKVHGFDLNKEIVNSVNKGLIHIYEPYLDILVKEVVSKNLLIAASEPQESEVYIITVPTPFKKTQNKLPEPSIDFVETAIISIIPLLKKGDQVIIESTCPVGTTRKISKIIDKLSEVKSDDIFLSYCPERVLPGNILEELVENDRVIGGFTEESGEYAKKFYKKFCKGQLIITDDKTAELVKLAENSYRDVSIAFANELSIIADHFDVRVNELIKIANHHPRVEILNPGCGVGGHCIAVDPWFIASSVPDKSGLIQMARKVNLNKEEWVINQIIEKAKEKRNDLNREPLIGLMGLSFKPNIDDLRESPAFKIAIKLHNLDLNLLYCEPNIKSHKNFNLHSLEYLLKKADFIVFLVKHNEFLKIDLTKFDYIDFCGVENI